MGALRVLPALMKSFLPVVLLILSPHVSTCFSGVRAGFYLPDSLREISVPIRTYQGLIVLPVIINDTVQVNLILDTGCRNLVLFGDRFRHIVSAAANKTVNFSGLGEGRPLAGRLSINNKVSIEAILGERIPIIVVPDRNLFKSRDRIDGIIGYDIFIKFEIELQPLARMITFRAAQSAIEPAGYLKLPLRIEDSRPMIQSTVEFEKNKSHTLDVMIDTGSSLGLLLKTPEIQDDETSGQLIGRGLNGVFHGSEIIAHKLLFDKNLVLKHVSVKVISSPWQHHASMGMQVLKEYVVILNYCKAYMCLKKIS